MDRGPPILGDLDLNGHKVFFALAKIAQTSFCNHICRVRVWMWICFFDIFIPQRRNTHLSVKSDMAERQICMRLNKGLTNGITKN